MPTGYTAELCENGQTLREYAFRVARAFFWQCRDDNGPLPEEFKGDSSYHADAIKSAMKKYALLKRMTKKQQLDYGNKIKRASVASYRKCIASNKKVNTRLIKMAGEVSRWQIPESLTSLKEYMLSQIRISMEPIESPEKRMKESQRCTPLSIYREALKGANRDIKYHTEKLAQSAQQLAQQNQFLKDLRESLAK